MLVKFTLKNWMSFREEVTFSMATTRERQHKERIPKLGKFRKGVLPIAVIYGGNASGKSNFFEAFRFAKRLVVKGSQPENLIPVEPFRLDSESAGKPSRFCFVLYTNESLYEFCFVVNRTTILEEKLVLINSSSEKVLYHRRAENQDPCFHNTLKKNLALRIVFNGTRENQLFLTNSVSQKIDNFLPVYNWFKDTLELVGTSSRFGPFHRVFDEGDLINSFMNESLSQLDTGINRLGGEEIPIANLPVPKPMMNELMETVKEGEVDAFIELPNDRIFVSRVGDELIAKKLVTFHQKDDGTEAKFMISNESDGSKRLIDLLPAIFEIITQTRNRVFVIDEFDRSLHTILSRSLLETFLSNCSNATRSQLLLTTHDVLLMDQTFIRRDEMWVTERNSSGNSSLYSLSEFEDIRYDKGIRKSYLNGRMGGVPNIFMGETLNYSKQSINGTDMN